MTSPWPKATEFLSTFGFALVNLERRVGYRLDFQRGDALLRIHNSTRDTYCHVLLFCGDESPVDLQVAALALGGVYSDFDAMYWKRQTEDEYVLELCKHLASLLKASFADCDSFEQLAKAEADVKRRVREGRCQPES